uniref:Uncharacterized protein n=1 Tax=Meloidogyne enterolobii TaxID=390850 RepID=A0A6V7VG28_MELEN|nr:unnamed protein product [Meloidogyne enterolobii]
MYFRSLGLVNEVRILVQEFIHFKLSDLYISDCLLIFFTCFLNLIFLSSNKYNN